MICPHCQVAFHQKDKDKYFKMAENNNTHYTFAHEVCPECDQITIFLRTIPKKIEENKIPTFSLDKLKINTIRLFPLADSKILPDCIPKNLANDFLEAFAIQTLSPKGSAALSRRCLETLLKDYMHCAGKDLNKRIDDLLAKKILPPYLAHDVDAIRTIGNFAAHPIKSNQSGEIVEVEQAEVEWQLQILEALFDFQFVHPQQAEERRNSFNSKLEESGKPTLKVPT